VSVRLSGRILQRWIARGLDRARYVVCDSQKTMDDFHECFPNNAARILVIYLGLNRAFHPPSADEIRGARGVLSLSPRTKYLLHVGGNSWYKNRLGAMQIFAALRQQSEFREFVLVMAGAPWNGQLREFARTRQIENAVIEAANASDTTLTSLYGGAEALIFPSLEEGFGWPVLEAQACGCPVITTNRPPMTEVAGEAAIFIDPSHPQSAANTIQEQWNRRSILRESGFRNLQRFSPEKMFDAYSNAYNEAVSARR
jgi:glycosyltransferase involved in cell wall biosynthesis